MGRVCIHLCGTYHARGKRKVSSLTIVQLSLSVCLSVCLSVSLSLSLSLCVCVCVCVCVCAHVSLCAQVSKHTYGGWRTEHNFSQVSPFSVWIPGSEIRS
jgi:hypothetical protein